ncbi:GNAT family N-acetyltransferase [Dichotomicrobium thermohalophilum]|uniref:Ribosomal-protein-alanine N-acetyltransferase n=1 Tax=Dichotomicrobium thermohalophilum TaxID=933063 RepID=A0A397QB81_9HYPH|nr:GNAT family N-acetyltransferase [Dichotomicrobium thermohalophilum]RIA55364.1 ribosomal-protein-alanine N-acetyltransferase [Dichotomicrobium thermohalophilum]
MRHVRAKAPPFTIAPLTTADAAALAALHALSFPPGWPAADFRNFLSEARVFGFGTGADPLSGFILCRAVADEAEVLTFGVTPERRRQGRGRRLLAVAMEEARQRGARHFFVDVAENNLAARNLYEKTGFFCVGRREGYYRGAGAPSLAGTAALVLRCDLDDAAPR